MLAATPVIGDIAVGSRLEAALGREGDAQGQGAEALAPAVQGTQV